MQPRFVTTANATWENANGADFSTKPGMLWLRLITVAMSRTLAMYSDIPSALVTTYEPGQSSAEAVVERRLAGEVAVRRLRKLDRHAIAVPLTSQVIAALSARTLSIAHALQSSASHEHDGHRVLEESAAASPSDPFGWLTVRLERSRSIVDAAWGEVRRIATVLRRHHEVHREHLPLVNGNRIVIATGAELRAGPSLCTPFWAWRYWG